MSTTTSHLERLNGAQRKAVTHGEAVFTQQLEHLTLLPDGRGLPLDRAIAAFIVDHFGDAATLGRRRGIQWS